MLPSKLNIQNKLPLPPSIPVALPSTTHKPLHSSQSNSSLENSSQSINFFQELSKIVNTKTSSNASNASNNTTHFQESESNSDICLISKEKLHPNHITLSCNHKFNYLPIYKEVLYQKNKLNPQYEVTKLHHNQVKCPYCRTITNKLLPYIQYPSIGFSKVIHAIEPDCIPAAKCSHIIKHRRKSMPDSKCEKNAVYYQAENILMCPSHYKLLSSKNVSSCKNDAVSTTPQQQVSNPTCSAILKTGPNSGKPCSLVTASTTSKYCKRHSKIYSTSS